MKAPVRAHTDATGYTPTLKDTWDTARDQHRLQAGSEDSPAPCIRCRAQVSPAVVTVGPLQVCGAEPSVGLRDSNTKLQPHLFLTWRPAELLGEFQGQNVHLSPGSTKMNPCLEEGNQIPTTSIYPHGSSNPACVVTRFRKLKFKSEESSESLFGTLQQ